MNPIMCYFLLQLLGLYAMLLVLDYYKRPGSRYLDESAQKVLTYRKPAVRKDKAA